MGDNVTGLISSAEYNARTTLSGIPAMVMACVKLITINYAMFVNPFATNTVQPAQIHSWWHEEISMNNPAQRNSDPPRAYISMVNQLFQQRFILVTFCIRLLQ
jgi:hypothetical protein